MNLHKCNINYCEGYRLKKRHKMIVHSMQSFLFPPVFLQPLTLAYSFFSIKIAYIVLQLDTYSFKHCYKKKSPNLYFPSQIDRDEYKTG